MTLKRNLIPIKQSLPIPFFPSNQQSNFYLYRFASSEHFLKMESYDTWSFMTDCFHLTKTFQRFARVVTRTSPLFLFTCMHGQSLSCVWLFATLWTLSHQAPLSKGIPRQEDWSGLFPSAEESSQPSDRIPISCIVRGILYHWVIW